MTDFIEPREKRIAELEKENAELKEKISVLLSCKNCSENKGGWICVKEYENKCLSQKIEYIKELKKENAKLKNKLEILIAVENAYTKGEQLTKAKEIIEGLMRFCRCFAQHHTEDIRYKEAEQFISEVEK